MKNQNSIIKSLLYLLFILFSFGNLTRISFFGQQVNGYAYEFILGLLIIYFVIKDKFKPIADAYQENRYIFWFFAFTFFTFFINWNRYSTLENFISILYQIRLIGYFIFFFYFKKYSLQKPVNIFIFITVLISIIQYFFYPDLRNLLYLGWDPHLFRIFGVYLDTYVAVSIYGLIFFYLFFQKRDLLNKILLAIYSVFIIMTFSRIGYMALLGTLLLIYIKKDLKKILVILLILMSILIIVPKPAGEGVNLSRVFSIKSRIADYLTAIDSWKYSPVIGIGYNRIRYFKKQLNLIEQDQFEITHSGASFHSSFLIILVTTGIIGFGLFILGLIKFVKVTNYSKYLLTYIGIISLADNSLLHPFILLLLLTMISLSRKLR